MTSYFDPFIITNPPNDETVDPEQQINDNWKEVDDKLHRLTTMPGDFPGLTLPKGLLAFSPDLSVTPDRIAVWNGSAWCACLNIKNQWSSWTTLPLNTGTVEERTNFTPKYRVNLSTKRVRVIGGVIVTGGGPWDINTTYEITSTSALPPEFAPAGGKAVFQIATGVTLNPNTFASAVAIVELKTSPDRCAISIRHQGDSNNGNFAMLDRIEWSF